MTETIYVWSVAGMLLVSGIFHIGLPELTERFMRRIAMVRAVGALLLVLAIPCLLWHGWYFWSLFVALAASGVWRFFFPQSSIRAQQRTYPRWVHGCLLLGGAALVLTLRP
jgi:hypothetical protein